MKILLDECMPHDFRHRLTPPHDVRTVSYMGWDGIQNGKLLALAAQNGFDVLVSVDQGLATTQNVATLPLSIIIVHARSTKLVDVEPFAPQVLAALNRLQPRSLHHVF